MAGKNTPNNSYLEKFGITEQDIYNYCMDNRSEDFPMDRTLGEFYGMVRRWKEYVNDQQD